PAGKQLFALDNNSIGEAEEVEWIAATSGRYRLRITPSEAQARTGRYDITLIDVKPETDRHRTRISAARQLALATEANRQGTRDTMLQAIRYFEAARSSWHAAEDPGDEARTLCATALIYIELGDREKALAHAMDALPLAQTAGNDGLLGRVLDCIGEVYNNFS